MTVQVQLRRDAGQVSPFQGPWVRARQVARELGPPDPLDLAEVTDARGKVLGWGLYSPESELRVRMLSWGEAPPPEGWLALRIDGALQGRAALGLGPETETTGYREINSEGDGLPGLVVDRYGDDRVVQLTTAPMVARQPAIVEQLARGVSGDIIVTRPESAARREGFTSGVDGQRDAPLRYRELGIHIEVPAPPAQKTGAYHDQRDNRRRVAQLAARVGGAMLDLGCHVGGFSLQAAAHGVPVVAVDSSESALDHGRANAARNGLSRITWVRADMFGDLDEPALAGPFGTIVFDPPKVAASRRDRSRAIDAMVRTAAKLMARLSPSGLLVLCSCSHHVDVEALDAVAMRAAARGGGSVARLQVTGPGIDHPVAPGHAEGEYLRVSTYQRR